MLSVLNKEEQMASKILFFNLKFMFAFVFLKHLKASSAKILYWGCTPDLSFNKYNFPEEIRHFYWILGNTKKQTNNELEHPASENFQRLIAILRLNNSCVMVDVDKDKLTTLW